jgi:sugar transferase (PEP-CTERM system associated)
MVRAFNTYVPARMLLLGVTEALLVWAAFLVAVLLRFGSDADLVLGYEHGLVKIALVVGVFFFCMWYLDLYDGQFVSNTFQVLPRLLQVVGTMSILLAFVYYTYPQAQLGRRVLLVGVFLVVILVLSWRQMFFPLLRQLKLVQRAIVFGTGPFAVALSKEATKRPELGIEFVGYVAEAFDHASQVDGLPCLGGPGLLPEVVRQNRISRVIVAMEDRRGRLPLDELLKLKCQGVLVEDGIDFYEAITGKVPLDSLKLSWLLFSPGFQPSRLQLFFKGVFSFCFAAVGLVLSLPLMLFTAFAIRLDSPGPIILRQGRVGKDGDTFTIYKFRTMRHNVDPDGKHDPAQRWDARITRVGRWLRRARLDELPQLYNIVRGDMYFVGPRPFVPSQEAEFVEQIPFYRHRWAVKPGATGWAQVNRGYCASIDDNIEKLAYDLFYIKNMSFGLDLIILLQTCKILLLGRGSR